jgi:hypothetical protein
VPEPLLLPELARSLRAFGAPRDAAGESAHSAIFSPLLEARARAGLGDVEAALSAMRGEALAVRIEGRATAAAAASQPDPAHGRARAARAVELVEPLRRELTALDALVHAARGGTTESAAWQRWVAQLRRVFGAADDACRALSALLAETPPAPAPERRWFGGR